MQKKFVLPSNPIIYEKVLSFIGESLRSYKHSLRVKYIKEGTTKEELYALPAAELGNSEGLTCPYGVGDTMWYGFVDLCFSDKFQVSLTNLLLSKNFLYNYAYILTSLF